jgi:hypothetical protein
MIYNATQKKGADIVGRAPAYYLRWLTAYLMKLTAPKDAS